MKMSKPTVKVKGTAKEASGEVAKPPREPAVPESLKGKQSDAEAALFAKLPANVAELYFTTDGRGFIQKSDAVRYAATLEDHGIYIVKRK